MKLLFVIFNFRIYFNAQIYNTTHFYLNIFKYKSFYLQLVLVGISFHNQLILNQPNIH